MSEPTPARRAVLRWSEAIPDDRVVDAAADVHRGLAGETLELGRRVEPLAGVPMVVVDTDPRGEPVQVDGETVVELERPPEEAAGGAEVLVLVDASYSMRGGEVPAWDRARNAAVAFLASGRPLFVRAGLAAFTHEPRVLAELGDPSEADPDRLDDVDPRGQSDPGAALDWAVRTLHYEGDPGNHRAAVLVTDADAPGDGVVEAGRRAANLGVAVHAARLDPPGSEDPLEQAAAAAGGTYQAGEPPDPLKPALEAVARAVDASVDWTAPEGTDADETAFEVILRTATDEEDFP